MLFSSYHRIFLENCATDEDELFFCIEYPYSLIFKKNFKFLGHTVSEKNAMIISRYHPIFLQNHATEEHEIFFA